MTNQNSREDNARFENEVRRTAEAVWGLQQYSCRAKPYPSSSGLDELDGYVETRDATHLLMVTVSTNLKKVQEDVAKLQAAKRFERQRNPMRQYLLWLITKDKLQANHLQYAYDNDVISTTLDEFRNRFFDAHAYLTKRKLAAFGSARNPSDNRVTLPENIYVTLPMDYRFINPLRPLRRDEELIWKSISLDEIASKLMRGEIVVITAPFGAGKSITNREIFLRLAEKYQRNETKRAPVAINLREHTNHNNASIILRHHANSLGFEPDENLVVGWRAGLITLLIDGFDEVASVVVTNVEKGQKYLKQARRESLRGVSTLIDQTPSGVGILICGRDHYFDDAQEMIQTLGINGRHYSHVRLGEFDDDQVQEFLKRNDISREIPDWLPRKPLLLGHLTQRTKLFFEKVLEIGSEHEFGYAWNRFLELICSREGQLESAVMDPQIVRRVLERVACFVRSSSSGIGPITEQNLVDIYELEAGAIEDDRVKNQLQRLPGLTVRDHQPGVRSFVDLDLLAALQGSAVVKIIQGEFHNIDDARWQHALSNKGIGMASYLLSELGWSEAKVMEYFRQYSYRGQLAADCFMIALALAQESGYFNGHGILLREKTIGRLDLEEMQIENLTFQNCIIEELILGPDTYRQSVRFKCCDFGRVFGSTSKDSLPNNLFDAECSFQTFDTFPNNNSIIKSDLPGSLRALLTVLRKIYIQPGSGRRLSALYRGITDAGVSKHINSIINILTSEKIIVIDNQTAHPIRRQQERIDTIFAAPKLSQDIIVQRAKELDTK